MRRLLLDTGFAADYVFRRRGVPERAQAEARQGNRIGIGIPVLAELHFGIERSITRERNIQRLRLALATLTVWPLDERAAAEYGRIAAELRRIGRPMQTMDMLIASIALSLGGCTVVTRDSDFAAVAGLAIEAW